MYRPLRILGPRAAAAGALLSLGAFVAPPTSSAQAPSCLTSVALPVANASPAPLRFGIYPGGPAGSVDPKKPPVPEDRDKRLAAVQELAGGRPFVVHIYAGWSGHVEADDRSQTWLDGEIAGYTSAGIQVELVARYEPRGLDTVAAVSGFAAYTSGLVRRYGSDPRFVALQVGNEANLSGAPDASDGGTPGAVDALVAGVLSAKAEVRRAGHDQVSIGMNWAYDERPAASGDFWAAVARSGGPAFARAVDWVGLDAYPGTWTPQLNLAPTLPARAGDAISEGLRQLRDCYLPMAGIGRHVPLHVSENGFPTGPGRSAALQALALDAMVRSVHETRGRYNVSDYRWFDLRDSASADPSFESQYGITDDRYAPKPAFAVYRDLISVLGRAGSDTGRPAASAARCLRSPVQFVLARAKGRVARVQVAIDGRSLRVLQTHWRPRTVRVALRPGRRRVTIRQTMRSAGGRAARVRRAAVTVCARST